MAIRVSLFNKDKVNELHKYALPRIQTTYYRCQYCEEVGQITMTYIHSM